MVRCGASAAHSEAICFALSLCAEHGWPSQSSSESPAAEAAQVRALRPAPPARPRAPRRGRPRRPVAGPSPSRRPRARSTSRRRSSSSTRIARTPSPSVTNCGTFAFNLDVKRSPKTSASIDYLVRRGFYNGLTFHRVAEGFVIQGGDPIGDGSGGPGYTVVEAPPPNTQYVAGRRGDGQDRIRASRRLREPVLRGDRRRRHPVGQVSPRPTRSPARSSRVSASSRRSARCRPTRRATACRARAW